MNIIESRFPIREVTVYPSSALVIRKATLTLAGGENRIIVKNLPDSLSLQSVRIEAGKPGSCSIVDLCVDDAVIEGYDENKYRKAKEEINALELERSTIEAEYFRYNDEFTLFLTKESIVNELEQEGTRPIQVRNWQEYFTFLRDRLRANRDGSRDAVFRWFDLVRKIETASKMLAAYGSYDRIREHRIAVTVRAAADGDHEFLLKYMVSSASWYPAYALRASVGTSIISLSMFAMISQSTGEDWEGVSIHLSTAVPLSNCELPELPSKRIRERQAAIIDVANESAALSAADEGAFGAEAEEYAKEAKDSVAGCSRKKMEIRSAAKMNPPSPAMKMRSAGGAKAIDAETASGMAPASIMAGAPPPTVRQGTGGIGFDALFGETNARTGRVISIDELDRHYGEYYTYYTGSFSPDDIVPRARENRMNEAFKTGYSPYESLGGFDYRYKVAGASNSIPSNGVPIQTGVDIRELPLTLVYVAVPMESEAVYLRASFKNGNSNPLPKGPAQVFVENTFLGNIVFPTLGTNGSASVSLGIDRDIKIMRREEMKRRTGGIVKKGIVIDSRVEIECVNHKAVKISLDVYERIPMTEMAREIEITDISYDPRPAFVTKRNIVMHSLALDPGDKRTVVLAYTIRHPEDFRLTRRKADRPHYDSEGEVHA